MLVTLMLTHKNKHNQENLKEGSLVGSFVFWMFFTADKALLGADDIVLWINTKLFSNIIHVCS